MVSVHPDAVTAKKGLSVFADMGVGDHVQMLCGEDQSLQSLKTPIETALEAHAPFGHESLRGALVVACGGVFLHLLAKMGEEGVEAIHRELSSTLGGHPFLGSFSFGEQGAGMAESGG